MAPEKEHSDEMHSQQSKNVEGAWMVRPCEMYREEYRDCSMWRSKFHQLFTTGVVRDCSDWKQDYENCLLWKKNFDYNALDKVIRSEKKRVANRVATVLDNETWKLRETPPADWNAPLPEGLERLRQTSTLARSLLREKAKEERMSKVETGTGTGTGTGTSEKPQETTKAPWE